MQEETIFKGKMPGKRWKGRPTRMWNAINTCCQGLMSCAEHMWFAIDAKGQRALAIYENTEEGHGLICRKKNIHWRIEK